MLVETKATPANQGPAGPSQAPDSPASPIWQTVITKYYDELHKGGVEPSYIDKHLWKIESTEDVVAQIKTVKEAKSSESGAWSRATNQLEPVVLSLNHFAAVTSQALGVDAKVAAVIWGSVRIILKFSNPVFPEIVEILKTLEHTLPSPQQDDNELPMTEALEKALSDMYGEIIVFCARAIVVLRNSPDINRNRLVKSKFIKNLSVVIENIHKYSRQVDEAARIQRPRESNSPETLSIQKFKGTLLSDAENLPCFMVPYGLNLRFFGRDEEYKVLQETLNPKPGSALRAIGIHGMGGVGKSQLARHYANTSQGDYQVIAWIPAETEIKIVHGFASLASKLGLVEESSQNDYENLQKARDWLNKTKVSFLLIFDNVEKSELLDQVWPTNNNGSVIITSRSSSQVTKRALHTLSLEPFPIETSTDVIQSLTGLKPISESDNTAMQESCTLLGGLPLAMVQVSDFIRDRGYSYAEFLRVYKKSAEGVFAKAEIPIEYHATVLTTWEASIMKLSEEGKSLQSLLAFFDPSVILERLITNTKAEIGLPEYEFLKDEFNFGEALAELTRTSMVTRKSTTKTLSIHHLIQLAVFSKIPKSRRIRLFGLAVEILYFDFLNNWKACETHQSHEYTSLETCEATLPHVKWLMQLSAEHKIKPDNMERWVELVFRSGAYLWKTQEAALAITFFEYGLNANSDVSNFISAQAYRLCGHAYLDMSQPSAALGAYLKALALREVIDGDDSPAVADICDSVACAYTKMNDVENAYKYFQRARNIHTV